MNTPWGNPISNYSLGSAWLTAKVGGTVNKLITELHYAGGDFCAYKQDWELRTLCCSTSLWCVSLPAVLLGVGRWIPRLDFKLAKFYDWRTAHLRVWRTCHPNFLFGWTKTKEEREVETWKVNSRSTTREISEWCDKQTDSIPGTTRLGSYTVGWQLKRALGVSHKLTHT